MSITTRARFWIGLLLFSASCGNGVNDVRSASASNSALLRTLHASWISLNSLVYYSRFDEAAASQGTPIADSSPSLLSSLLQTSDGVTVKTTVGIVGSSLLFDGLNDYVATVDPSAGSPIDATTGASITLSAWIKPAALIAAGGQILTKGGTVASDNVNYSLQTADGAGANPNYFSFSFYNGAAWSVYHTISNQLTVGSWQHVAFTFTFGTPASATLYYNGAAVAGAWTGDGSAVPSETNEALWIGGSDAPAGAAVDNPFDGFIDEVSIWKRALSASEIQSIYLRQSQ